MAINSQVNNKTKRQDGDYKSSPRRSIPPQNILHNKCADHNYRNRNAEHPSIQFSQLHQVTQLNTTDYTLHHVSHQRDT